MDYYLYYFLVGIIPLILIATAHLCVIQSNKTAPALPISAQAFGTGGSSTLRKRIFYGGNRATSCIYDFWHIHHEHRSIHLVHDGSDRYRDAAHPKVQTWRR
jgi:hypothetical protein